MRSLTDGGGRRGDPQLVAPNMAPKTHPIAMILELVGNMGETCRRCYPVRAGERCRVAVTRFTALESYRKQGTRRPGLTAPQGMCTVRKLMGAKKPEKDPSPVDFESAMRDLEAIVGRLEQGEMPLEESLAAFERGVMLTRTCQLALREAEQKVEILLKKSGEPVVEQFNSDDT
jgi:exodeoxyribonuclease VII small subunit